MKIGLKKKEKKHPNDYPLLSFRLDEQTKEEITIEVEELVDVLNERRDENSYVIRKNDVFVEALKEGLKILRKKHKN